MPTIPPPPSRDATLDPVLFWFRHKTELLIAALVLMLGLAGFIGYRVYTSHRESAAAEALANAKTIPEYRLVIERYGGTPASASAYLLLAESQRTQKNFKEANATLQMFIDKSPQHELASTARLAMAGNLESMGKTDEALSTLQRLVANYPKSFVAPLAMLSQVHLLKAKGQIAEARHVCENLMTQYRESYLAGEASRQLRLLRPKSEEKPSPIPGPPTVTIPKPSAAPSATLPPNPAPKKP
jgi:TolA-binding protein